MNHNGGELRAPLSRVRSLAPLLLLVALALPACALPDARAQEAASNATLPPPPPSGGPAIPVPEETRGGASPIATFGFLAGALVLALLVAALALLTRHRAR